MKVAFLVNDLQLSGGVGVVVQHARQLSTIDGWDVTLVLVREQEGPSWHGYEHLPHLHVRSREQALSERYDVAVATWWETTFTLFELSADRYAYFVQSLEDRFYRHDEAERLGAGLTLDLPVAFITEARWIADTLDGLRPDAPCYLVRNGIDKDAFPPLRRAPINTDDPLRVLVEGSPGSWFKHVHDAIHAAAAMREPHHVTVVCGDREALGEVVADEVVGPLSHPEMAVLYERSDVVLKLSSVEGMFGPPLEGFHRGATCVVTPVTGHEEYVEHGWNGMLTDWEDLRGTARQLDLLARDRELLQFLRTNALETARAWPSWEQSSQFMAAALTSIRREPPPNAAAGAARLLADLRGGVDIYNGHLRERVDFARRALRFERPIARLRKSAAGRLLLAMRRNRVVKTLAYPLRPLTRRARRLLS
ncbi:MAG TPA: glycosyltransferase family 4 protein [Solirubrobacteraceae bacterium]|nr:glycosyltransferase family 4 protein [Solirubrobacteraceae bacterium]